MIGHTYKFFRSNADRIIVYSIYGLFIFLGTAIPFGIAVHEHLDQSIFILFWCLDWALLSLILGFAVDTSDLLVSDVEIARRIGPVVCMRFRWAQVTRIREQTVKTPKQLVTTVRIERGEIPFWRFELGRQITFSNRFDNFLELVELLNAHIARNNIPVEINSKGTWDRRPKLEPPPPDQFKDIDFGKPSGPFGM